VLRESDFLQFILDLDLNELKKSSSTTRIITSIPLLSVLFKLPLADVAVPPGFDEGERH
jgi:hypothetical protein